MLRRILAPRFFSTMAFSKPTLFVDKDTKVICQGMTGKEVSLHH